MIMTKIYKNAVKLSSGESNSNIKSEKAGEVSITYGSSDSLIKSFSILNISTVIYVKLCTLIFIQGVLMV